jgi:type IV pilus assembly protein PilP
MARVYYGVESSMAKKKKSLTGTQKIVVVALVLIVAQLGLRMTMMRSDEPVTIREAIEKQLASQKGMDARAKAQARLSIAVNHYMGTNQGQPPASLHELTPTYFDVVPTDPSTGKDFEYKVMNNRPVIGDMNQASSGTRLAAAGSSKETKGNGPALSKSQQDTLIATLEDDPEAIPVVYNPTGKRDPFLPFNFAPEPEDDPNKTELEKYQIGQLRLAIVLEGDNPTALVENAAGKGFYVRKGTKIGPNGGEIVEIQRDKILILETSVDFTGKKKTRTVEMKLRTKDADL